MNVFKASIVLLSLLLIGVIIFSIWNVNSIEEIENMTKNPYYLTSEGIKELSNSYKNKHFMLHLGVNTSVILMLDENLIKLENAINSNDLEKQNEYLNVFRYYLDQLKTSNKVSLENIF